MRFYLEKVVFSKQIKEKKGKTWDGEAIHLAVQMFINNLRKKYIDELVQEIPKLAMEKYKGKITITEWEIRDFLMKFYGLIKDEGFDLLVPERTFLSIKRGIIGTPDIIARKFSGEFAPIDVKFSKADRIKKEHLMQSVGEALLLEDFLRTRIYSSYLIYFKASLAIKIKFTERMKKEFMFLKKELEKISTQRRIARMSRLPYTKICM